MVPDLKETPINIDEMVKNDAAEQQSNFTADYCLDVWHHISKFVAPEDIGRFALICRRTAYVTSTMVFWKNIYQTHVLSSPKFAQLPEHFQANEMHHKRKGLRANVIRALFYVYRPFQERLQKQGPMKSYESGKFHQLTENVYLGKSYSNIIIRPCQKNKKTVFDFFSFIPKYYFHVFKEKSMCVDVKCMKRRGQQFGRIHESEEIYYNRDEYCVILFIKAMKDRIQTKSSSETMTPTAKPSSNVSRDPKQSSPIIFQSIQLQPNNPTKKANRNIRFTEVTLKFQNKEFQKTVVYNDVIQIDMYNWWEPNYDQVYREEY